MTPLTSSQHRHSHSQPRHEAFSRTKKFIKFRFLLLTLNTHSHKILTKNCSRNLLSQKDLIIYYSFLEIFRESGTGADAQSAVN